HIPERPIPLIALIENIKKSATNSRSGTGHQANTFEMDRRSTATCDMEEGYAAKDEVEGKRKMKLHVSQACTLLIRLALQC
ncbi:hypothetical protein Tco_0845093, partial [Tanacetum coccineum]